MDTPQNKPVWWEEPLRIFTNLSGWVLAPLVAGYVIGRWLDSRNGTAPRYFLITIGVAFVASVAGMVRQAKKEYAKIANLKIGKDSNHDRDPRDKSGN